MRAPFPEHYLITPEPAAYGETVTTAQSGAPSVAATSAVSGIAVSSARTSTDTRTCTSTCAPTADNDDLSSRRFLVDLDASLSSGIKLVQLRSKLLTPAAFATLAKQAAYLCHQAGARLILNGALNVWQSAERNFVEGTHVASDPTLVLNSDAFYTTLQDEVDALGADGLHLSSAHLMRCTQRPLRHGQWVSAACHTSADIRQAVTLQLDFVTLSPVLHTDTHPEAEPLGWERFEALSQTSYAAAMPIYALGGMRAADKTLAQAHGAHGIAAIRSFWVRKSR